jgi:hypothetical protein
LQWRPRASRVAAAEADPEEAFLNPQLEAHDPADLIPYRGTDGPAQRRALEQIAVGALAASHHAETGLNLPGERPEAGMSAASSMTILIVEDNLLTGSSSTINGWATSSFYSLQAL